ncbi:MAG: 5'-methylthioadenosine/S-adenosylhomocysteine nucleosidase [Weeksellaceae bacterium]
MSKHRVLFVGAMETEIRYLLKEFNAEQTIKLLNQYPFYSAQLPHIEIGIVNSFVGDINATIATTEAIKHFDPDVVLKIGCVGGNSADIRQGDVIVPTGFFPSSSWITKTVQNDTPSSNASTWQSVFGEKPYQVNSSNLGDIPYFFKPDDKTNNHIERIYGENNISYQTAYIGGGNMWFFDRDYMTHVAKVYLADKNTHLRWGADMESYAIAHVCHVLKKPFSGFYAISNSDWYDEPYDPEAIADMFKDKIVPAIKAYVDSFTS